jgi:DNA invertase Pin-like site-specific DNA recombinase
MKERQNCSKSRVGIYLRVSTSGQSTQAQETELRQYARRRGWRVHKVYADRGFSGVKASRPALDELLSDCRRRRLDVVLVWKFDRFARSLRQLVTALEEFRKLGVNFISATEGIDTTVASGELVFGIIASMAQFERSLIGERVKAGLVRARKLGTRLGRPSIKRLTEQEIKSVRRDRMLGRFSLRRLAAKYGTSLWAMQQLAGGRRARV